MAPNTNKHRTPAQGNVFRDDSSTPLMHDAVGEDQLVSWKGIATWVLTVIIGPAALMIGAWAHAALWAHDTRLTRIETKDIEDTKNQAGYEKRTDETLRRIEDKLDRYFEREAKRP